MPSRRRFLASLGLAVLVAGCGGSGGGTTTTQAPEPTPEQKAITDQMKADMLKKVGGNR